MIKTFCDECAQEIDMEYGEWWNVHITRHVYNDELIENVDVPLLWYSHLCINCAKKFWYTPDSFHKEHLSRIAEERKTKAETRKAREEKQ